MELTSEQLSEIRDNILNNIFQDEERQKLASVIRGVVNDLNLLIKKIGDLGVTVNVRQNQLDTTRGEINAIVFVYISEEKKY